MQQDANRLLFYLNTLYEFSRSLSHQTGANHILEQVLRLAVGTGMNQGAVLLRLHHETEYHIAAQLYMDSQVEASLRQQLEALPTDDVSSRQQMTLLEAAPEQPSSLSEVLAASGMVVALPLVVPGRLAAILGLGSLLSGDSPGPSQIQLLEALGRHAEIALGNALLYHGVVEENQQLRRQLDRRYQFHNIVGQSAAMQEVYEQMEQAIEYHYSVLITGESGTGKELVAGAIHHHSGRTGPFVPVNCAAFPSELIESELFGHERGAFSGADRLKQGLFERAQGGSLFLDEIAEMPYAAQSKLLRVLQEKTIRRVGGLDEIPVDVRIIAATNRDIEQAVAKEQFRSDLHWRFTIKIEIPPLRQRSEDIPLLVESLLTAIAEDNGKPAKSISPEALSLLVNYSWPGNIRELQLVLIQSFIRCRGKVIRVEDIPLASADSSPPPSEELTLAQALDAYKSHLILSALVKYEGKIGQAAKSLGISRQNLYGQMRRRGITYP